MKRLARYLLLSIALHVSAGWLLHGLREAPAPLAWQAPIAVQMISFAQAAPAPVHPAPLPQNIAAPALPKMAVKPEPEPVLSKPLPVSAKPAIAKSAPVAESRPAQAPSTPAAPTQAANSAAVKKSTPAAVVNVAAPPLPTTPVLSLRPSFVSPPPPPRYPSAARRRNLQGTVHVEVCLDERGQQLKLTLIRSSGVQSLDQAALEAVTQWRFRPEIIAGRAVPSRVEIPIEFALTASR